MQTEFTKVRPNSEQKPIRPPQSLQNRVWARLRQNPSQNLIKFREPQTNSGQMQTKFTPQLHAKFGPEFRLIFRSTCRSNFRATQNPLSNPNWDHIYQTRCDHPKSTSNKSSGERGPPQLLKKNSENGGANENLSCRFPSIPRIAPGVAPRIVVLVLLKSWDAVPRMEFRIPIMEFRIPRAAPRIPRNSPRAPRMAFRSESVFPDIGVVPRVLKSESKVGNRTKTRNQEQNRMEGP